MNSSPRTGTPTGPTTTSSPLGPSRETSPTTALILAISTYVIWGFFPLYFALLLPASPFEVIIHRALWGLVFCLLLLSVTGKLARLRSALRQHCVVRRLALAGFLIVVNWSVYVYAVLSGHTTDAAIGYFINPLVTVALALVVLRERMTTLQKIALALGTLAVAVLVIGLGRLPWISLALALSFATYSLVKKKVAHRVHPIDGMAIETGAMAPFLLAYLAYLAYNGATSFHVLAERNPHTALLPWHLHLMLLIGSGFLTMVPLILFATAARSLPLGVLGFIQYISPIMQLLIGIFVFHETMEPIRWVATGIVWLALVCLTVDGLKTSRRIRRCQRLARTQ